MKELPVVTCSHTSLTLFRIARLFHPIVERKDTSHTQSLGREACFSPGGIAI
jgi:hypothetical protein